MTNDIKTDPMPAAASGKTDDMSEVVAERNALFAELELLREENRKMTIEVRKAQRALSDEQTRIERIQKSNEAKRQFSEIVLAERSRLERNMNLLLQNSRDPILFFDAEGKLVFATDSLLKLLGVAGFGLIAGKNFREVFGSFFSEEDTRSIERFMAPQSSLARRFMRELRVEAGTPDANAEALHRDYHMDISLMANEFGAEQGWLLFIYDTTDLMQAKREAEQANAAKSDFLATISHEIRTPMNAIIGLTKMMEATELSKRQSELLGKIETSSNAMLSLINDILDFSKIEAGKLELLNEYFDFKTLLDELASLYELMLAQKSLKLNTFFAEDLPQVALADAKRIRQVINNIMTNAYKYTPSGWVDFTVERFVAVDGSDRLRFLIADTGIGIKEEELGRLFVAFEQLDVVRNKHIVGTGLGLAITRLLTEMMGGVVSVRSRYGKGSTFVVEVPLVEGTPADLPQVNDDYKIFTAAGARILVVDDVEVNLEIAEFMLEPYAVEVETAYDGLQAVEKAEKTDYDLILMDHMMPTMDGVEATCRIRQIPGSRGKVPIVALTANAITGVQQMFIEAGFDDFISKPIDASVLASVLYDRLPQELIQE